MTQAELPQLSLQRYLDLVKRRRWQVLPVSLLGLLVGGIVAFFIPRYYVADTTLLHQGEIGDSTEEDPMKSIVASATLSIPLQARKVITEKLKWPEARALDDHDLEQFAKAVRDRVQVFDINGGERRRDFAVIRVLYKDREGSRAAEFLNALVKTWIETRIDDLRKPAERARKQANDDVVNWGNTYDSLLAARQELELRYQIDPEFDPGAQRAALARRQELLAGLQADLRAKETELAGLAERLQQLQEQVAATPMRVPADKVGVDATARPSPEVAAAMSQVAYWEIAVLGFHAETRTGRAYRQSLAAAKKRLQALVAPAADSTDGLVDNPAHAKAKEAADAAAVKFAELGKTVELLRANVLEGPRLEERIRGFTDYSKLLVQVADAKNNRDLALAARQKAEELLARLNSEAPVYQPFPAAVPPRPTEPNILVVALIGCVLGLGAAIGLILLLDLLQGSFKTVDDVERGLPVPVLGGLSHLETEAERSAAVRGRTRATVVASVFVALVVAIGLIYHFDPTRLPPAVRDLLQLVLGRG